MNKRYPIHSLRANASLKSIAEAVQHRSKIEWDEARKRRELWQKGGLANCGENKRRYDEAASRASEWSDLADHLKRHAACATS